MRALPVSLFDTATPLEPLRERLHAAAAQVLDSGRYILGPEVAAFEHELADHLVAGADAQGLEGQRQRIGAVGHADRVARSEVGRELLLERADLRAEDVAPAVEDLGELGDELVAQGCERRSSVEQGYGH